MMMVKMIFSGNVLGILVCTPFLFLLSELSPQKKQPRGNFRLAGLLRLPLIGVILAQKTALHNTPLAFSPIFRKIFHERPGTFITIPKNMPIRQHLWGDLPHAFRRNAPHAIGPAASSCSRGFPQERSKVGQSAQKRRSADRFCCILPVVFKISTKICLFLCIVCEWTNDAPACIIKPETREVQQKLK